jgi:hypothetical protein
MATPNLLTNSSITPQTDLLDSITTDFSTITSNELNSNTVFKINSLTVTNIDGSNNADVTVKILRTTDSPNTEVYMAYTVVVPADASYVPINTENNIYLMEGDKIQCSASANGDLHAICSYEIMAV